MINAYFNQRPLRSNLIYELNEYHSKTNERMKSRHIRILLSLYIYNMKLSNLIFSQPQLPYICTNLYVPNAYIYTYMLLVLTQIKFHSNCSCSCTSSKIWLEGQKTILYIWYKHKQKNGKLKFVRLKKTLRASWTKDLVKLECTMTFFSWLRRIGNNKLTIFTNIINNCGFSSFARREWSYSTVYSDVTYRKWGEMSQQLRAEIKK